MYEAFYGFRERPFSLLPDPRFLYLGKNHSLALAMLEYGLLMQSGFVVITGEVGSGKTTLIQHVLKSIDSGVTVGVIANTHRAFGTLLQWVMQAFGLHYRGKDDAELYEAFVEFLVREHTQGRRTVLIIDEAQNVDMDGLEALRMLSNVNSGQHQMLQVILVGQPELQRTLQLASMRQLAQRVGADYHLDSLGPSETAAYIRHRLEVAGGDPDLFEPEAMAVVASHSRGIPRLINILCETALVYGLVDGRRRIGADLVLEVVRDKARTGIVPLRREPAAVGGEEVVALPGKG